MENGYERSFCTWQDGMDQIIEWQLEILRHIQAVREFKLCEPWLT